MLKVFNKQEPIYSFYWNKCLWYHNQFQGKWIKIKSYIKLFHETNQLSKGAKISIFMTFRKYVEYSLGRKEECVNTKDKSILICLCMDKVE